jgi:hypothetical protein
LQFSIKISIKFLFICCRTFSFVIAWIFHKLSPFSAKCSHFFFPQIFQSYLFAGKIIKTLVQYNTIITTTANTWDFFFFFLFPFFFFFLACLSLIFSFGFSFFFFLFFWRR